jgi:hypothetical protein
MSTDAASLALCADIFGARFWWRHVADNPAEYSLDEWIVMSTEAHTYCQCEACGQTIRAARHPLDACLTNQLVNALVERAAAERDVQRLHDYALEMQDRLAVACDRLRQRVYDDSDAYFGPFVGYNEIKRRAAGSTDGL